MKIRPGEVVAYSAGGAVVCGAFLVFVHLVTSYPATREWFGQNGAAWVQAVGSVAAIVFGFWYPEHRLRREEAEKRVKYRRALVALAGEMVDYLIREGNLVREEPGLVPSVDEATHDDWLMDIRSVDVTSLDYLDRGRYSTLRHHLRTIGRRMRPPITAPIDIKGMNEMCAHLMKHVLNPLNESGAWDDRP